MNTKWSNGIRFIFNGFDKSNDNFYLAYMKIIPNIYTNTHNIFFHFDILKFFYGLR